MRSRDTLSLEILDGKGIVREVSRTENDRSQSKSTISRFEVGPVRPPNKTCEEPRETREHSAPFELEVMNDRVDKWILANVFR